MQASPSLFPLFFCLEFQAQRTNEFIHGFITHVVGDTGARSSRDKAAGSAATAVPMAMTLHHPAATTAAEARRDMDACCACACAARRRSCCCCFRLRKLRGAAVGLAVCLLYCLAMRDVATLLGGPRATNAPCSAPAAREILQHQSLIQSRGG